MNARDDVCTEFVAFSRGEFVGYALRLWVGQWMVLLALSVAHGVNVHTSNYLGWQVTKSKATGGTYWVPSTKWCIEWLRIRNM
jgi:hypothetical protein